ncbi:hypothetical protein SAMN05660284_00609 [Formivibrio citricus]|uniref:DUF7931 domain-containing protein n=1 Tax=Formivibrio citricus TaxID=83765 RepID=A0A1I4WI15_9NEIS|nr:hypothetical protein [Formivibrio citricus]SFN12913.1 hypothetical protein SAMN05660284_00609 [Formivibrio citricus]
MSRETIQIRFDTYSDYKLAFASILKKARKRIWICEKTLEESGLDSGELHEDLWKFFTQPSPGSARILVQDAGFLANHCPRLMQLRERFAHLLEIRTPQEAADRWQQGMVLVDEDDYLVRRHFDWPKGEYGIDGRESAILEQMFTQLWEHSAPPGEIHRLSL